MQSSELNQFRRYQPMLMYGGAAALTAVVIVAFLINSVATVRSYMARESDMLSFAVQPGIDLAVRAEATLRSNVRALELAWKSGGKAPADMVAEFGGNGNVLRVQPVPDEPPVMVAGRSSSAAPPPAVGRFIHLSEAIVRPWVGIAARNGDEELTAYVFSIDRSLMLLFTSPSPPEAQWATLFARRPTLFDEIAGTADKPLIPPDAPLRRPGANSWPAIHWLPSYTSPMTGERCIRMAAPLLDSLRRPFGVVVAELSVKQLTEGLPAAGVNGVFLLLARDGTVVGSRSKHPIDDETIAAARKSLKSGIGTAARRMSKQGYWLTGWSVGDTGWTVVYLERWSGVAESVQGPLATSAVTTTFIIVIIWTLLLLFDRRVYRPVLKRSERVFESEHLSRTLIETAPVGLGLIGMKSGTLLLFGPTMIEMARRMVVPAPTLAAELAAHYRKHRENSGGAGNDIVHEELTLPTHDSGSIDLAVSVAPARYQGEDVLVTSVTDVTAHKRLEQTLREARETADLASAAKSAFLAMMSHEIRTPLNAILGNLELLSRSQLDVLQRDRLKTIRVSSDALLAIISDVLDFSKIEAGEMTLERIGFDALEVASRSLTMFGPLAHVKGVRLSGDFGVVTVLPMQGDPTRLGQVINNLLSNAIKFTEQGEVTLRVSQGDDATVVIEVEDSGIGMTGEQQAAVFAPFSQADTTISRRFGGTGLGLTLCARLTHAMGGRLTVCSELGKGSCFTVRVPLGDASADAAAAAAAAGAAMPRFDGEPVAFVAVADAWHAYAVPALKAWGLTVQACRHPAQIDDVMLDEVEAVILCGERDTWHADDENRLIEGASWVIACSAEGPLSPVATGRLISVSSFSLLGLANALLHTLRGKSLESANELPQVLQRPLKVLAVEDNAGNRMLLEEQLKLLGCEAVMTENGKRALARLLQETFDVLLTDLSMPEMDGYALAREARARWPRMPIIAATAATTLEERKRCEAVGIAQVVSKPLSLERLRAALSEVVDVSEVAGLPASAVQRDSARAEDAGGDVLGGRALPDEVRAAFLASFELSINAIAVAQKDNDAARMLAELHSLRGALGVFGMGDLEGQCARLESVVRDQGVAAAADMLDAFDIQVHTSILLHVQTPREALSVIRAIVERTEPDRAAGRLLSIVRALSSRNVSDAMT